MSKKSRVHIIVGVDFIDMKAYSKSHLIGYDSSLPTKSVKLPLKYPTSKRSGLDRAESFKSACLCLNELLDITAQIGLYFPVLQIGLLNDLKTISLLPLVVDEAPALAVEFQKLQINLPHPVISKCTFACQFVPLALSDEPFISIDLLDVNYLLISLRIELSDFIVGNSSARLLVDNFSNWVNISVPYSFELRSSPFCMKALTPLDLIVSMSDGGLLHFQRLAHLSSFSVYNFSEDTHLMSLDFVSSFFGVSLKADITSEGVSSRAAVDILGIKDGKFVTLSTGKVVTLWDIKTHKKIKDHWECLVCSEPSEWLTTVPRKYLCLSEKANNVSVSVLLARPTASPSSERTCFEICSWDLSEDSMTSPSIIHLESIFSTDSLKSLDIDSFRIQDFCVTELGLQRLFYVLWKSSHYSLVSCHTQHTNGDIEKICSILQNNTVIEEIQAHKDSHYYKEILFDSGLFDDSIILAALGVFRADDFTTSQNKFANLRQEVELSVLSSTETGDSGQDTAWYKFALLCFEFRKVSCEVLSLLPWSNVIILGQLRGAGVVSEAHFFERFEYQRDSKISCILSQFSAKFSTNFMARLADAISQVPEINPQNASQLAMEHLSKKFSEEDITFIMQELDSVPNVIEEVRSLISGTHSELVVERNVSVSGEGYGLFSKLLTIARMKSIKKSHERILLKLFVLFLLCDMNETILELLNKVLKQLRVYKLMSSVFGVCLESSSSSARVERSSVSKMENLIFWTFVAKKHVHLLQSILQWEFSDAFDDFSNEVLKTPDDSFILDLALEMIDRGEGWIAIRHFILELNLQAPTVTFIMGLISLQQNDTDQYYRTFVNYDTFKNMNGEKTKTQLINGFHKDPYIVEFLASIFSGSPDDALVRANYYHQLSRLIKSANTTKDDATKSSKSDTAFKFETLAIQCLLDEALPSHTINSVKPLYLRNQFELAMETSRYDSAAASLACLQLLVPANEFRVYLAKLVREVIANHKFKMVFSTQKNKVFIRNCAAVDSIILELANEDLILSNSLRSYEYLYAWRLNGARVSSVNGTFFDKRGAAEALYIFITRFKNEKDTLSLEETQDYQIFELKILELYKVILNSLKTFEMDDEKWIRKQGLTQKLGVITIKELEMEYYKWVSELEKGFL